MVKMSMRDQVPPGTIRSVLILYPLSSLVLNLRYEGKDIRSLE